MSRGRTGPQIAADTSPSSGGAALLELLFDSGAVRLAVGSSSLVADGNTYLAGKTLSISPHDESADGFEGLDATLAGLESGIKTLVFAEPYQGRIGRLLEQRYDADGAKVGTPTPYFIGRIRAMSAQENPADHTMAVSVTLEHFDAEMEDDADLRNTDAEQKRRYPTDLGCEYLASLVDRVVTRDPPT